MGICEVSRVQVPTHYGFGLHTKPFRLLMIVLLRTLNPIGSDLNPLGNESMKRKG